MYQPLLQKQRNYFHQGETRDVSFRIKKLKILKKELANLEEDFLEALKKDLNKSKEEAFLTELGPLYQELSYTMKQLPVWMKPEKVKRALSHVGSDGYIYHEPYGCALIIAPWNYPLQLAIAPLIGAIAGGNCAIVKPSELTPNVSGVLKELITRCFKEEYIAVVLGGVEESEALLRERFDTIFFTGSVAVGKVVMEAAAKHLTPVTLELGGKSPAIVDKKAKIDVAAKRIAWGKFLNAGQTCVAPDYVFVHESIKNEFIKQLTKHIHSLYQELVETGKYPRIVSERHFNRLLNFLNDGDVIVGGQHMRDQLVVTPTVMINGSFDSALMQEEIFGPILPLFSYRDLEEVKKIISDRPSPLALYVFTEDKKVEEDVIHNLSFGGGCVNDTIMHLATPYLPFGGKGESGMGAYHGHESFKAFTHQKSVLKQATSFDLPIRYKQGPMTLKLLRKIFR